MRFSCNDVIGLFVYDYSDTTGWSEKVKEYHDKGEVIDVDFDVVVETYFEADFLNKKFVPVDDEAKKWAKTLMDYVFPTQEEVNAVEVVVS